jgi:curved DNA-binding protein CbpA
MSSKDAYRILHVDRHADTDVISAAYRVLARKLHPDTDSTGRDSRRMAELNWAYGILRDPDARARYDRDQRSAPPPPDAETADRSHGAAWAGADPTRERLDFGRYDGWTLREVARRDIEYLRWLSRHAAGARHRPAIAVLLREHDATRRAAPTPRSGRS